MDNVDRQIMRRADKRTRLTLSLVALVLVFQLLSSIVLGMFEFRWQRMMNGLNSLSTKSVNK